MKLFNIAHLHRSRLHKLFEIGGGAQAPLTELRENRCLYFGLTR